MPVAPSVEDPVRWLQEHVAELQVQLMQERAAREALERRFESEYQRREVTERRLQALFTEVEALKVRAGAQSASSYVLAPDVRHSLDVIEARGNVKVEFREGHLHVDLLRPIAFVPRTTHDIPAAEFANPSVAHEICSDLAAVAVTCDCNVLVEGNTKGGESEFWQRLADDRARIVAETMGEYGANMAKISMRGLPGKMGGHEVRTTVKLDISTMSDKLVPIPVPPSPTKYTLSGPVTHQRMGAPVLSGSRQFMPPGVPMMQSVPHVVHVPLARYSPQ